MTVDLLGAPAPTLDTLTGVIAGIARRARSRAPMEVIESAELTETAGIAGDFRGRRKPGSTGKRQVTLIERGDWEAATASVGCELPWYERRANLLIDGFDLPQVAGTRLLLGSDVVLEVTVFTDPCARMESLAPGLFDALWIDWRGGVCTRVLQGGHVRVGDLIRVDA